MAVTSTLTIAGTVVDRAAARVSLLSLSAGLEGAESLEFAQEVAGSLQGSYSEGQSVTLSMTDGVTTKGVFTGQIVSRSVSGIGAGVIAVGYHALGLRYLANQVITTGADGTGRTIYNLPHTDPNWSQNLSGLSVGTILADYFAQHAAQLSAIGVSQPPASDLAPLSTVPVDPVMLSGRILDAADGLLAGWGYSKYAIYIDPDTSTIRVADTTALTPITLTLDSDPIQVPSLSVDTSNCYTAVVLRGAGQIGAAVLSLGTGTLVGEATSGGGWTPAQRAAWNWASFAFPSNSVRGTITSMTSTTITADAFAGPVTTWAVNYWSQSQVWVQFGFGGGGASYSTSETAEVTAVTATAGGSATFTVDVPFQSTIYTSIEVRGAPTGAAMVYRRYNIPDTVQRPSDGAPLNRHLTQQFMGSVPWAPVDGIVTQATGPSGEIYDAAGTRAFFGTFQIMPSPDGIQPGYIVFDQPTVSVYSTQSSMVAGTPDNIPSDVKVLVPYSDGSLSARAPASGYQGTAATAYGIQRTLYRDYPSWVAKGQSTNMATLAQNFLDCMKDAVISGGVVYHGLPFAFMTMGRSLNLAGGMAAGSQFAAMNCPVRRVTVEWPDSGGARQVTHIAFDSRRKPYSGDSLYLHPLARRESHGGTTISGGGPVFAGMEGFAGADAYQGTAPDIRFGDEGGGKRRERTRLGSESERTQAAEAHDLADRQARGVSESRAMDAEDQKHQGADDIAHLDRTRSARLRAAVVPHSEEAQRLAGREATGKAEAGENTERLVASDNRRRSRSLEGRDDREYRMAAERPEGGDAGEKLASNE
jgi:hypothetical protein